MVKACLSTLSSHPTEMKPVDIRTLIKFPALALSATVTTALFAPSMASELDAQTPNLAQLDYREIGPATMGGRISDLAVVESDPRIIYAGAASGGLWKTTNHGITWEVVFRDEETSSVGDVAVAPSNPNAVWVGTGEPQNRQSSAWGAGIYRSLDAGRNWTHVGLTETRHVGRIRIHPRDQDIVYVAAVGNLWAPNEERGVYKTTDGGESWEKVLFIDEDTGCHRFGNGSGRSEHAICSRLPTSPHHRRI